MRIIILIFSFILFYHCAAVEIATNEIKNTQNKINKQESIFKVIIEAPYQIKNSWFYPQKYNSYNKIGLASEIKDLKIGIKTFNGEYYHPDNLTGAHATLPLPSTINVLNISNGYSVNVRINHRGGFSKTSLIDLSPEVFKILKLDESGDLVRITLIDQNESFILKEAKTYKEEKLVDNAPVLSVSIEGLEKNELDNSYPVINSYDHNINDNLPSSFKIGLANNEKIYLKIAQFTFLETAKSLKDSFNSNLDIKILDTYINNKKHYNVVVGPFIDIEMLMEILNDDIFKNYDDLSIILI